MNFNAFYNGRYMRYEDVKIPLTNRSVFFGDAVYDAVIGRNGKCFMLTAHIERLFSSAGAVGIKSQYSRDDIRNVCERLSNNLTGCFFIYIQLSRTAKKRLHAYSDDSSSSLLITVSDITSPVINGKAKLITHEDKRYSYCNVKSVNLLPAVIAATKAKALGADEAVFIRDGFVTECSHSNIHIVKDGKVLTHPTNEHILAGISRAHLISVCKRLGIACVEQPFSLEELFSADEVAITSTSRLLTSVHSVDGKIYPQGHNSLFSRIGKVMYADFYSSTV